MRTFLIKSSLFIIVFITGIIIISKTLNAYISEKIDFKLNTTIKSVVFGHSQPETAFNDSLIDNFQNLAESGESYFYTYIKLKHILNHNPQIETVFIEFSNVDVPKEKDESIWSDKYINWRYPIYSPLMTAEERCFLQYKNPKAVINVLPKTFKKQITSIHTKNYDSSILRGYNYLKGSSLDSLITAKAHLKKAKINYYEPSEYNLKYLRDMISFCKKKNLNVFLIRSPMYKDSYYLSNNELLYDIKNKNFSDIKFLDFVDFPLTNNKYRDLNHLNNLGATKFSLWFNSRLKEMDFSKINDNTQ